MFTVFIMCQSTSFPYFFTAFYSRRHCTAFPKKKGCAMESYKMTFEKKRIYKFNWCLIGGTFRSLSTHNRKVKTLFSFIQLMEVWMQRTDLQGCFNYNLLSQRTDPAMLLTLNKFTSWRETCCLGDVQGMRHFCPTREWSRGRMGRKEQLSCILT